MITQPPLIAIGYRKTGSSWLDSHFFNNSSFGFICLDTSRLKQPLISSNPLAFDVAQCREEVQKSLPSSLKDKIPVIAMERLTGSPHSGGYDSKEIADRLFALFPNGRILIVIREQKQMILSTYNQYVRQGGPRSLRNLITQQPLPYKVPNFGLDHFTYHLLINYYIKLFGKSNVLVLPYEQFRKNPQLFISQILAFNKIKGDADLIETLPYDNRVNLSLSWISTMLMRSLNPLIMNPNTVNQTPLLPLKVKYGSLITYLQNLEKIIPPAILKSYDLAIKQRLMAELTEIVGDRYQQSNAITSELIGIDLSQYKYDLPVDYSFSADHT